MKAKNVMQRMKKGLGTALLAGSLMASGCDYPKNFDYAINQNVLGGYMASMQKRSHLDGRANLYVQLRSTNPLNDISSASGIDVGGDGIFDDIRYGGDVTPEMTAHVGRLLNMATNQMSDFKVVPAPRIFEGE